MTAFDPSLLEGWIVFGIFFVLVVSLIVAATWDERTPGGADWL